MTKGQAKRACLSLWFYILRRSITCVKHEFIQRVKDEYCGKYALILGNNTRRCSLCTFFARTCRQCLLKSCTGSSLYAKISHTSFLKRAFYVIILLIKVALW